MHEEPGQKGAVPLCQPLPAEMGLLGNLWGMRLEISAPFPSVGNGGSGRARHSFAVSIRSLTCQGRACGNARCPGRELVPVAPISPTLAECAKAIPPWEGKVVFLLERVWK